MQKQVVFTESEWRKFRIELGRETWKHLRETHAVIAKENGQDENADPRAEDWWIGTMSMVCDAADNAVGN